MVLGLSLELIRIDIRSAIESDWTDFWEVLMRMAVDRFAEKKYIEACNLTYAATWFALAFDEEEGRSGLAPVSYADFSAQCGDFISNELPRLVEEDIVAEYERLQKEKESRG